jgi:hypothetical protein
LCGEESNQQPTQALVTDGHQPINRAMLHGHRPSWMFPTTETFATMQRSPHMLLNHEPTSVFHVTQTDIDSLSHILTILRSHAEVAEVIFAH